MSVSSRYDCPEWRLDYSMLKKPIHDIEEDEPTGEYLYVDNYNEFEVDTDGMREDFPECFTFACCDGNLKDNPHGCVTDFHRERYLDEQASKRVRAV